MVWTFLSSLGQNGFFSILLGNFHFASVILATANLYLLGIGSRHTFPRGDVIFSGRNDPLHPWPDFAKRESLIHSLAKGRSGGLPTRRFHSRRSSAAPQVPRRCRRIRRYSHDSIPLNHLGEGMPDMRPDSRSPFGYIQSGALRPGLQRQIFPRELRHVRKAGEAGPYSTDFIGWGSHAGWGD